MKKLWAKLVTTAVVIIVVLSASFMTLLTVQANASNNEIAELKAQLNDTQNTSTQPMNKEIHAQRMWAGSGMNDGDWKVHLSQGIETEDKGWDIFIPEEDILIVGIDFGAGFCGLTTKFIADGEYHGFAEISKEPFWGSPNHILMVAASMAIHNGEVTENSFDHVNMQFTEDNYISLKKGEKLFIHYIQTAPSNGNSTSGYDAVIYYVDRY